MPKQNLRVPFGYEPPKERDKERGTIWVYDSFEGYSMQELLPLLKLAEERQFAKLVFYPLHEETLRRMSKQAAEPYYRRVQALEALLEEADPLTDWTIERFEGKRKKYTPADTAFRFLEEKYSSPFFVYVTDDTARKLAGYEGFESWLTKVRLLVAGGDEQAPLPALLAKHAGRWEHV
ncbi:hypothetical protein [Paenibacillus puerhi]|uniref:hypothetical protein n=1 Tax=Paenibacillus puerhi TaxID=2692622 RepID=UPI001357AD04|nr:hypothetical protein [Paenibacillus puerhi]